MNGDHYYTISLFISAEASGMSSQMNLRLVSFLLSVYFLNGRLCKIPFNSGTNLRRNTFYLHCGAGASQEVGCSEGPVVCLRTHGGDLTPALPGGKVPAAKAILSLMPHRPLCHSPWLGRAGPTSAQVPLPGLSTSREETVSSAF